MPGTFFRHRGLTIPTCMTTRAWRTCRGACRDRVHAVSFGVGGVANVPGIFGACATRNFLYLIRGPCHARFKGMWFKTPVYKCFTECHILNCLIIPALVISSIWITPLGRIDVISTWVVNSVLVMVRWDKFSWRKTHCKECFIIKALFICQDNSLCWYIPHDLFVIVVGLWIAKVFESLCFHAENLTCAIRFHCWYIISYRSFGPEEL